MVSITNPGKKYGHSNVLLKSRRQIMGEGESPEINSVTSICKCSRKSWFRIRYGRICNKSIKVSKKI